MSRLLLAGLLCLPGFALVACAGPAAATRPAAAPATRSLYDRLGGKDAIGAVTDEFLKRVAADGRINARFANADLPHLRQMLVEQLCQASGGPCAYSGKDMKVAHAGMDIREDEFGALVEDLKGALQQLKVPAGEQGELLGLLAPAKPDIVSAPAPGAPAQAGRDAVGDRAQAVAEAARLLEKAGQLRKQGNRNLAELLFSSAEQILGPEAVAELAGLFREGAPPRVTTPLGPAPADAAPQPATVGNSDDEDKPEEKPRRGSLQGTLTLDGKAKGFEGRGVVTLEPLGKKAHRRAPVHRTMEQRNRAFAPLLLAVPVGSTVSFPNFDSVYHNVFSRAEGMAFDLGIYKHGQSRDLVFDKEGVFRLGCNLHANMQAYVVVVSAPHYAIADDSGHFSFRSLEPGKYRLKAWSDRTQSPVVREITIAPEKNRVSVALPADAKLVDVDKFGAPRGQ